MTARPVIWISGALNLALAAAIFLLMRTPPPGQPLAAAPETAVQPAAASSGETPPTNSISPPARFQWSQIASDDLKAYRDNLLAIGCPQSTARDIILAEINERFVHRRQALLAALQGRYWEFVIRGVDAQQNEWGKPIEALGAERDELIRDVLGDDYAPAEVVLQAGREDALQRLAWLPEEKRGQLFALEEKRKQAIKDWAKSVGGRADDQLAAEDNDRLQALQKDFDEAKQALLTPEELEESRLLSSKESLWAAGLSGFEPTEAEWRKVTKLRSDFEEAQLKLSDSNLSDEARAQRIETLQAELEDATKTALGDRYAQYELANNGDYQAVQKVTQRYGLSDSVATQAYNVQQAAIAEAEKVRGDAHLSAEDRQAALAALQQETERTLAAALGDQVLSTYKEYGGDWLRELNRSGDE